MPVRPPRFLLLPGICITSNKVIIQKLPGSRCNNLDYLDSFFASTALNFLGSRQSLKAGNSLPLSAEPELHWLPQDLKEA